MGGAGGGDAYALTCRVTPAVFAWPVTVEAHELYRVQSPGDPVDMKELHDSRVLHSVAQSVYVMRPVSHRVMPW